MFAMPRPVRLFLPLPLLAFSSLAALSLTGAYAAPVSFSVPDFAASYDGEPSGPAPGSTVNIDLAARSGTAKLTPGVKKIVQTTGSFSGGINYDGESSVSVDTTITCAFVLNGVSHPQTQEAFIYGDGDEESGDFYALLGLDEGSPVTYDLGTQGKVDVTPLAASFDSTASQQPPLQYRLLLHDVPGYAAVKSVQVSPGAVYGGAVTFGKVSLAAPAPAGGTVVSLTLGPSPDTVKGAASVPDTVVVPAGRTFVTFPIVTAKDQNPGPSEDTTLSLYATAGGKGSTASFKVLYRYYLGGYITSDGYYLNTYHNVTVTAKATGTFTLTSTSTPAASIPDNTTTGLTSALIPKGTGTISGLVVGVDITHPRIADLVITLQGPDGTTVFLQNKTGGTQANLQTSYPVLNAPVDSLSAFTGKNVQGTWKLTVKDAKGGSVGTLNAWSLTFTYDGTITASASPTSSQYYITDLKEGTYTVTPSGPENTFTPASRTITVGPGGSPSSPGNVNFDSGAAVIGLSFSPDSVFGGGTATGTIKLTEHASSGGLRVTLTSDTPSTVSVPAFVVVPSGKSTATFTVKTHPPSSGSAETTVYIYAVGGGGSTTGYLTVQPASP